MQSFSYSYQIKKDEMGAACSSHGEIRNAYKIVVVYPEGKRPIGRLRRRWKDNIKIDLGDIGFRGVDRIHLAQYRDC
jgi:hypothetical protein